MIEYTENPKWFYKSVIIDNLELIQQELNALVYKKIPNFDSKTTTHRFTLFKKEEAVEYSPALADFIKSLGIYDRWAYCGFFLVAGSKISSKFSFTTHIDHADWREASYALNIPVVNCEGAYTVWYDTEIEYDEPTSEQNEGSKKNPGDRFYPHWNDNEFGKSGLSPKSKRNGAPQTEIARWHANQPAWINVSIPHQPVNLDVNPRVVISLRFIPELHDILYINDNT
jgi:hypothetical protein